MTPEHNEIVDEVIDDVIALESLENQEISHEITLHAEPVTTIGNFPITNALITAWTTVAIIIVFVAILRTQLKEIPRGIQNFFEYIIDGALSLSDQVTNDRSVSEKAFPLVFSIFLFILINNWLGILPFGGFGVIHQEGGVSSFIPFLRSGTADINTTLALATLSVIAANIFGILSVGIWKAFNKYINLQTFVHAAKNIRKDPTVLVVAPVSFFVGVLEIIGEFAKVASLSFRLFGNVFAGEVLLLAMAAIFTYILPVPFIFLEIFVGLIQAFIFSILVLVYFTIAAQDHDEHEEEERHSKVSPHHNDRGVVIN